jgi:tetratricopeptide (TPR) repeat protein
VAAGKRHCAAVRDRHSVYYAEFLSRKEDDVVRGHMQETVREIDNIRAAWDWAVRTAKAEVILNSAISLWLVYHTMGWVQEGAATFGAAADRLRSEDSGVSTETREVALGLALAIQSFFSRWLGTTERAMGLSQAGLSLLGKYGPRRELAVCIYCSRFSFSARSDPLEDDPGHQQLGQEMLAISRQTGFYLGKVLALRVLGRYEEALQVSREAGDRRGMATALRRLGGNAHARHEYIEAKELYEEALAHAEEVGISWPMGQLYTYLGKVGPAQGEHQAARERFQQALAQSRHMHRPLGALGAHIGLGRVALSLDDRTTATRQFRQALAIAVETHFDLLLQEDALRLYLVASIAELLERTDKEQAVELAALARHHRSSREETRATAQELLEELRAILDPDTFVTAEERGQARDLEATIRELLVSLSDA